MICLKKRCKKVPKKEQAAPEGAACKNYKEKERSIDSPPGEIVE